MLGELMNNIYIYTPLGYIALREDFTFEKEKQVCMAFRCVEHLKKNDKIIYEMKVNRINERWYDFETLAGVQRVYWKSICDYLENTITDILIREANSKNGIIVLHGSAVQYKNKGIIVLGKKGSGKSTFLMNMVSRGFRFSCDDNIVFDSTKNMIYSLYSPIRVKDQLADSNDNNDVKEYYTIIEDNAGMVHLRAKKDADVAIGIDCLVIPTKEKDIDIHKVSEQVLFDTILHNIKNPSCIINGGMLSEIVSLSKIKGLCVNSKNLLSDEKWFKLLEYI